MDATQTWACPRNPPLREMVERRVAVPVRMGVPNYRFRSQHLVHRDGNRESVCGALPGGALAWAGYGGTGVPLVAALGALLQPLYYGVDDPFRDNHPGRSPSPLLERPLHAGYRVVPVQYPGARYAVLHGEGRQCDNAGMARPARDPSLLWYCALVAFLRCAVLGTERRDLPNFAVRDGTVATAGSQIVGDYSEFRFDSRSVFLVAHAARKRLAALQRAAAVGLLCRGIHHGPVTDRNRARDGASGRQPLAALLHAPPPPACPEHSFLESAVLPRFHPDSRFHGVHHRLPNKLQPHRAGDGPGELDRLHLGARR